MIGGGPKRQLRAALAACRMHFIASFWFQGLVSITALVYPVYMIQVYERVVPSRNLASLVALLTGAILVLVFSGVFTFIERKLLLNASLRVDRLLAGNVMRALIERSSREQSETGGQLLRDLGMTRAFYTRTAPAAIVGIPWALLFLSVLFLINFFVGIAALVCLVIEFLVTMWNKRASQQTHHDAVEAANKSQRMIEANIRSADAVVSMGMLGGMVRKWQAIDNAAVAAEARGGTVTAAFGGLSATLSVVMTLSLLSVAAVAILEGQMAAGFAFACVLCFNYMMKPLHAVIHAWEEHDEAKAAAKRVEDLLEKYPPPVRAMSLPRPKGEVAVRRASYFPPGAQKPILGNVTFGITPGESVGIVGAIGSGKTTLVRMLVGLTKPTHGEVRIDGTDAASWHRDDLGKYLGYLPQEISLLSGTVAENIGRLGLFDEKEIVAAAERAGVHNIILKLPQGYDTLIGEGGLRLSGGQRQLIGLARAIVGVPPLVILDEPNSNLDGPGENTLVKCISDLKAAGTTVIMVSHRPALVQNLDRVILIREGTVGFDGPVSKFFEASGRPAIRIVKSGTDDK